MSKEMLSSLKGRGASWAQRLCGTQGDGVRGLPRVRLILPQITVWLLSSHFKTKESMYHSQDGGDEALVCLSGVERTVSGEVGQSGPSGSEHDGLKRRFHGTNRRSGAAPPPAARCV